MTQGYAYNVLGGVDVAFDAKVGPAWRAHTYKRFAVRVFNHEVGYVRWPPKWRRRR